MEKQYVVYILGNQRPTLYVGVTSNLARRLTEHRQGLIDGFTKKYAIHRLLYYEVHKTPEEAIFREKCIKRWKREWKLRLIKSQNPDLKDLSALFDF